MRDPKKILQDMRAFYASLYSSDPTINFEANVDLDEPECKLTEEQCSSLEGLLTLSELTSAAKNLNRNKAPGTDGLPIEVYIMFWNLIKIPLLNALNHAYDTGLLHTSALDGIISLIPKANKDSRMLKNLRPITLLNTDYKILEKCLANRLKTVLHEIIHEDQKGFMSDRKISTNIRRILDTVEFCEVTNTPVAILSIDAEKAFDRIETDSLLSAMKFFGIGKSFQKWTKLCFTKAHAAVINYGHISEKFPVTRGVKQGVCCSAFYFLVLIETLARMLRQNKNIKGIDINGISKLLGQFADDLDIYLWGTKKNIREALQTVKRFQKCSGMKINVDKSSILKLGAARDITFEMGIEEVKTTNILGVEVLNEINDPKLMEMNFEKILLKAQSILDQWRHRGLSLFGKVTVINTMIASLFVYKMSVLPSITDKYIDKLNAMMNSFLWNNRKPKIKLEILQIPKI